MSRSVRTRPEGSGQALSEAYDTALLDLDGVVYAGGEAIDHAVPSLAAARDGGMRLAYVTNNALRTPDAVAAHLTELGIPAEAGDVITSAQAVRACGWRCASAVWCRWSRRTTTRRRSCRGTAVRS